MNLPISPQSRKEKFEISANDDILEEEINLGNEDEEEVSEEGRRVKIPKDPVKPSRQEVE